ncbi:ribonuclease III [Brachyspira pilosicoli]|uniref:Ribonuclease 3 n=1 Tax=Brachyspira pilosicoli TaxID=52584 RepID=A0A5C8FAF3_BRAPL|nr:ribonuclease III [Brachyspira pilosicoli]TXJ46549.1 ribonuclease III [Brachyspira pilosicoli]
MINKILLDCEKVLQYNFKNKNYLLEAITHRTFANENGNMKYNQRLEFLGDSVLSLIISEHIYKEYNSIKEGKLSKIKSYLVSQNTLANISKKLKLGDFLLLGKGEEASGGRERDNMLEDLFEAIIGAIYLDSNLENTKNFVMRVYKDILNKLDINNFDKDYKTILQEMVQKQYKITPTYKSYEYNENDNIMFRVEVYVKTKKYAYGVGKSKKEAEMNAAKKAIESIEEIENI